MKVWRVSGSNDNRFLTSLVANVIADSAERALATYRATYPFRTTVDGVTLWKASGEPVLVDRELTAQPGEWDLVIDQVVGLAAAYDIPIGQRPRSAWEVHDALALVMRDALDLPTDPHTPKKGGSPL